MGDPNNNLNNNPHLRREVQGMGHQDEANLRIFDDWIAARVDPRRPGNLAWLMQVYPGFVERRMNAPPTVPEVIGVSVAIGVEVAPEWARLTPAQRGYGVGGPSTPIVERTRPSVEIPIGQPVHAVEYPRNVRQRVDVIQQDELQYLQNLQDDDFFARLARHSRGGPPP